MSFGRVRVRPEEFCQVTVGLLCVGATQAALSPVDSKLQAPIKALLPRQWSFQTATQFSTLFKCTSDNRFILKWRLFLSASFTAKRQGCAYIPVWSVKALQPLTRALTCPYFSSNYFWPCVVPSPLWLQVCELISKLHGQQQVRVQHSLRRSLCHFVCCAA